MIDESVSAVERYLRSRFRDARVELVLDSRTGRHGATLFQIEDHSGGYSLQISNDVLADASPVAGLQRLLCRSDLADHLRANEGRIVLLTENAYLLR